jgi:hypothetical protein
MAGYRLAPQWPIGMMLGVPALSMVAAACAAAIVAYRWTRARVVAAPPPLR